MSREYSNKKIEPFIEYFKAVGSKLLTAFFMQTRSIQHHTAQVKNASMASPQV
jgi:hypothetical protein